MLANISKTKDALNLSVIDGQLRFPECMIVLIKDDNGILWNLIEILLCEKRGVKELEHRRKVFQLLEQMFFGRDDVD